MTITLEQSTQAGFPDAGAGAVGLHATMAAGYGGRYLSHTLDAPPSVLHVRCLFAPRSSGGGWAYLGGGWSATGAVSWSVAFDAATRSISLQMPGASALSATLPAALAWHSIEVKIDSTAGIAECWVNGLSIGTITGASISTTSEAWLGVQSKSRELTGEWDLDEWVIAEAPIGPQRVTPSRDDASDPSRWLVVYNADHADGPAWAEHYRAARGVPYANFCGLALPMNETISAAQYLALRDAVLAYLSENGLAAQVVGVLLGLGVPGYVDYVGEGDVTAVSSLLHTDATGDATSLNALHRDPPIARPIADALAGVRFTGRIDGADLSEAIALVDRATALMDAPPTAASGGAVWLDPAPEDAGVNPLFTESAQVWAQGPGPSTLRLPVHLAQASVHDSIHDDFAFWGWGQASVPSGFFTSPAGRRGLCVQLENAVPSASDQRTPGATHWLRQAVDAGYAAVSASCRPYTLSAQPQLGVFFEAIRLGWTLAEAWLVCQPFLRSGMQFLGDPLLTLQLPRSGFDIYGPRAGLEAIDLAQPALRLPETQTSVALSSELVPTDDEPATYWVRRIDAHGRGDGASASVAVQLVDGLAVEPPASPAWPDAAGWRVHAKAGGVEIIALWPTVSTLRGIARVQVEAERAGATHEIVWQGEPVARLRYIKAEFETPTDTPRLRWRIHHANGAQRVSPWSSILIESTLVQTNIPLYEVQP